MATDIKQDYNQNPEYWRKDKPKLQGDLEQRPYSVKMLGDVFHNLILDAGCGTGYVSRMIARKGAMVIGIDKSTKMLEIAREFEKDSPLNIDYGLEDITKMESITDNQYGGIICTGVVHHLSPGEYKSFLVQARRVLKFDSPLVISLVHPSLFYPDSPARNDERCSTKFYPIEDKPLDQSQKFDLELYDIDGNTFNSTLWHHPISFLLNSLTNNGFRIEQINEPIFRKEHRLTPAWGEAYGYPTHFQIKAVNGGTN